jgi:hypothetical protein
MSALGGGGVGSSSKQDTRNSEDGLSDSSDDEEEDSTAKERQRLAVELAKEMEDEEDEEEEDEVNDDEEDGGLDDSDADSKRSASFKLRKVASKKRFGFSSSLDRQHSARKTRGLAARKKGNEHPAFILNCTSRLSLSFRAKTKPKQYKMQSFPIDETTNWIGAIEWAVEVATCFTSEEVASIFLAVDTGEDDYSNNEDSDNDVEDDDDGEEEVEGENDQQEEKQEEHRPRLVRRDASAFDGVQAPPMYAGMRTEDTGQAEEEQKPKQQKAAGIDKNEEATEGVSEADPRNDTTPFRTNPFKTATKPNKKQARLQAEVTPVILLKPGHSLWRMKPGLLVNFTGLETGMNNTLCATKSLLSLTSLSITVPDHEKGSVWQQQAMLSVLHPAPQHGSPSANGEIQQPAIKVEHTVERMLPLAETHPELFGALRKQQGLRAAYTAHKEEVLPVTIDSSSSSHSSRVSAAIAAGTAERKRNEMMPKVVAAAASAAAAAAATDAVLAACTAEAAVWTGGSFAEKSSMRVKVGVVQFVVSPAAINGILVVVHALLSSRATPSNRRSSVIFADQTKQTGELPQCPQREQRFRQSTRQHHTETVHAEVYRVCVELHCENRPLAQFQLQRVSVQRKQTGSFTVLHPWKAAECFAVGVGLSVPASEVIKAGIFDMSVHDLTDSGSRYSCFLARTRTLSLDGQKHSRKQHLMSFDVVCGGNEQRQNEMSVVICMKMVQVVCAMRFISELTWYATDVESPFVVMMADIAKLGEPATDKKGPAVRRRSFSEGRRSSGTSSAKRSSFQRVSPTQAPDEPHSGGSTEGRVLRITTITVEDLTVIMPRHSKSPDAAALTTPLMHMTMIPCHPDTHSIRQRYGLGVAPAEAGAVPTPGESRSPEFKVREPETPWTRMDLVIVEPVFLVSLAGGGITPIPRAFSPATGPCAMEPGHDCGDGLPTPPLAGVDSVNSAHWNKACQFADVFPADWELGYLPPDDGQNAFVRRSHLVPHGSSGQFFRYPQSLRFNNESIDVAGALPPSKHTFYSKYVDSHSFRTAQLGQVGGHTIVLNAAAAAAHSLPYLSYYYAWPTNLDEHDSANNTEWNDDYMRHAFVDPDVSADSSREDREHTEPSRLGWSLGIVGSAHRTFDAAATDSPTPLASDGRMANSSGQPASASSNRSFDPSAAPASAPSSAASSVDPADQPDVPTWTKIASVRFRDPLASQKFASEFGGGEFASPPSFTHRAHARIENDFTDETQYTRLINGTAENGDPVSDDEDETVRSYDLDKDLHGVEVEDESDEGDDEEAGRQAKDQFPEIIFEMICTPAQFNVLISAFYYDNFSEARQFPRPQDLTEFYKLPDAVPEWSGDMLGTEKADGMGRAASRNHGTSANSDASSSTGSGEGPPSSAGFTAPEPPRDAFELMYSERPWAYVLIHMDCFQTILLSSEDGSMDWIQHPPPGGQPKEMPSVRQQKTLRESENSARITFESFTSCVTVSDRTVMMSMASRGVEIKDMRSEACPHAQAFVAGACKREWSASTMNHRMSQSHSRKSFSRMPSANLRQQSAMHMGVDEMSVPLVLTHAYGMDPHCGNTPPKTISPLPFQFAMAMSPEWSHMRLGFHDTDVVLGDLAVVWAVSDFFCRYFCDPSAGCPWPHGDAPTPGYDLRVWLTQPHITLIQSGLSPTKNADPRVIAIGVAEPEPTENPAQDPGFIYVQYRWKFSFYVKVDVLASQMTIMRFAKYVSAHEARRVHRKLCPERGKLGHRTVLSPCTMRFKWYLDDRDKQQLLHLLLPENAFRDIDDIAAVLSPTFAAMPQHEMSKEVFGLETPRVCLSIEDMLFFASIGEHFMGPGMPPEMVAELAALAGDTKYSTTLAIGVGTLQLTIVDDVRSEYFPVVRVCTSQFKHVLKASFSYDELEAESDGEQKAGSRSRTQSDGWEEEEDNADSRVSRGSSEYIQKQRRQRWGSIALNEEEAATLMQDRRSSTTISPHGVIVGAKLEVFVDEGWQLGTVAGFGSAQLDQVKVQFEDGQQDTFDFSTLDPSVVRAPVAHSRNRRSSQSNAAISVFNAEDDLEGAVEEEAEALWTLKGGVELRVWADYFNMNLRGWEPLLEPWQCRVLVESNPGRGNGLTIKSANIAHFNVTGALLEMIHQYSELLEMHEQARKVRVALEEQKNNTPSQSMLLLQRTQSMGEGLPRMQSVQQMQSLRRSQSTMSMLAKAASTADEYITAEDVDTVFTIRNCLGTSLRYYQPNMKTGDIKASFAVLLGLQVRRLRSGARGGVFFPPSYTVIRGGEVVEGLFEHQAELEKLEAPPWIDEDNPREAKKLEKKLSWDEHRSPALPRVSSGGELGDTSKRYTDAQTNNGHCISMQIASHHAWLHNIIVDRLGVYFHQQQHLQLQGKAIQGGLKFNKACQNPVAKAHQMFSRLQDAVAVATVVSPVRGGSLMSVHSCFQLHNFTDHSLNIGLFLPELNQVEEGEPVGLTEKPTEYEPGEEVLVDRRVLVSAGSTHHVPLEMLHSSLLRSDGKDLLRLRIAPAEDVDANGITCDGGAVALAESKILGPETGAQPDSPSPPLNLKFMRSSSVDSYVTTVEEPVPVTPSFPRSTSSPKPRRGTGKFELPLVESGSESDASDNDDTPVVEKAEYCWSNPIELEKLVLKQDKEDLQLCCPHGTEAQHVVREKEREIKRQEPSDFLVQAPMPHMGKARKKATSSRGSPSPPPAGASDRSTVFTYCLEVERVPRQRGERVLHDSYGRDIKAGELLFKENTKKKRGEAKGAGAWGDTEVGEEDGKADEGNIEDDGLKATAFAENKKRRGVRKGSGNADLQFGGPYIYSIKVYPPLRIENALCCDMTCEVWDPSPRRLWTGVVKVGQRVPLHCVPLDRVLMLAVACHPYGAATGLGAATPGNICSAAHQFSTKHKVVIHIPEKTKEQQEKANRARAKRRATTVFDTMLHKGGDLAKGMAGGVSGAAHIVGGVAMKGINTVDGMAGGVLGGLMEHASGPNKMSRDAANKVGLDEIAKVLTLEDENEQELLVGIDNRCGTGHQRMITLFSQFWFINATTFELRYKQDGQRTMVAGTQIFSPLQSRSMRQDEERANEEDGRIRGHAFTDANPVSPLKRDRTPLPSDADDDTTRTHPAMSMDQFVLPDDPMAIARRSFMFSFNDEKWFQSDSTDTHYQKLSVQVAGYRQRAGRKHVHQQSEWSPAFSAHSIGAEQVIKLQLLNNREFEKSQEGAKSTRSSSSAGGGDVSVNDGPRVASAAKNPSQEKEKKKEKKKHAKRSHVELGIQSMEGSGVFHRTRIIVYSHRYLMINKLPVPLEIHQTIHNNKPPLRSADSAQFYLKVGDVPPEAALPLDLPCASKRREVRLRPQRRLQKPMESSQAKGHYYRRATASHVGNVARGGRLPASSPRASTSTWDWSGRFPVNQVGEHWLMLRPLGTSRWESASKRKPQETSSAASASAAGVSYSTNGGRSPEARRKSSTESGVERRTSKIDFTVGMVSRRRSSIKHMQQRQTVSRRTQLVQVHRKLKDATMYVIVSEQLHSPPPYKILNNSAMHVIYFRQSTRSITEAILRSKRWDTKKQPSQRWEALYPGKDFAFTWPEPEEEHKLEVKLMSIRSLGISTHKNVAGAS